MSLIGDHIKVPVQSWQQFSVQSFRRWFTVQSFQRFGASRHVVQSRSMAGAFLCAGAQSRHGAQSSSKAGAFLCAGAQSRHGVQSSSMAGAFLCAGAQSGREPFYSLFWFGSHFPTVYCGILFMCSCVSNSSTSRSVRSLLFLCVSFNKHVEPISQCALVRMFLRGT